MSIPQESGSIVVVFWGTSGAGIRYTYRLARELTVGFSEKNVSVSLNQQNAWHERIRNLGVKVQEISINPKTRSVFRVLFGLPIQTVRFWRFIVSTKASAVLISMNFGQAWALSLISVLLRRKVIYVIHDATPHPGDYAPVYQKFSQRLIAHCASRLIAPSAFVAESALAHLPASSRARMDVCSLSSVVLRRSLHPRQLGEGPLRFLFLGRLLRYKGLHLLAEAVATLSARDDWRLTIAGNGLERDFVRAAFSQFPQVDLSRLDWLLETEVDELLKASDVLICPYVEASQSGVIAEGQSYGIPSLVTPVGALLEQVDHGNAGWVCRNTTASAIAAAMLGILENRKDYSAKSAAALSLSAEAAGSSNLSTIVKRTLSG